MWTTACAEDPPSLTQRARILLAAQQAMAAATHAVDTALRLAGSGAVYLDHPVQRCFRDLHLAAEHIYFSADSYERNAKTRFGVEQPTMLI